MRRDICQSGGVLGFARFNPATMPADPTFSSTGIEVTRNCGGGTVQASKVAVGDYRIRFNGMSAVWATCSVLEQGDTAVRAYAALSLISTGNWRVTVTDSTGAAADLRFVCTAV